MQAKEFIVERATDIVYHYTSIANALDILSTGTFKLATSAGTDVEDKVAKPGYPYFLSLTRSKVGDFHRYVGSGGAMFVLDGQWISSRYPVEQLDYWYAGKTPSDLKRGEWSKIEPGSKRSMWQYSPERTREAEDRVFSKENTIPIDPVTAVHIYIKEQDDPRSSWTRKALLAAKKRGIKVYLYSNESAWRLQDTRKALPPGEWSSLLKGSEPTPYYRRPVRGIGKDRWGRSSLLDWFELIKKQPGQELTPSADKLRYKIKYYGDQASQFKNDIHNARKPSSEEYNLLAKLVEYMRKEKLDATGLVAKLKDKWSNSKQ